DGNVKENTLDKQKTAWNKCSLQANKSKRRNNQIKGKIRITTPDTCNRTAIERTIQSSSTSSAYTAAGDAQDEWQVCQYLYPLILRRYRWMITNVRDRAALQRRMSTCDAPITINVLKARADEMRKPSDIVQKMVQMNGGMTSLLTDAVMTEFEEFEQENVLGMVCKPLGGPGCVPQSEMLTARLEILQ
ncbi:hypothetical protein PHLCEN_2v3604, partial [Hermanssonia centrifuga]